MTIRLIAVLACLMGGSLSLAAGPPSEEASEHKELRKLREALVEVVKKNDFDALEKYLDDEVVVTFMNAEVGRKPEGVRAYFDKMTKGPNRIVETYTPAPEVDELAHIYGNTAIATGKSKDTFRLTDGRDFSVDVRWTVALVKKEGQWKIAAFHASANVFDNPILGIATRRVAMWTGGIAAGVALLLGVVGTRLLSRKRSA